MRPRNEGPEGSEAETSRRLAEETARREAALAALHESEARFRGAFDHAAIGMAITSPEGRWIRVNAELGRILGYTEAELLGRTFSELTVPEDVAPSLELAWRLMAGQSDRGQLEKRFIHRDGRIVWAAVNVVLVRDSAGTPLYFVSQMQDITAAKRATEALRASEARYQRLLANTPGVVCQYAIRPDGSQGFTVVSEGARRLFGVDPAAVLAHPSRFTKLIHPDDRDRLQAAFTAGLESGTPWNWEGRIRLPGGEARSVWVVAHPALEPDGTRLCDGVLMDVTDQRQAASRLAESEQRYRSLFDHHPDAVISLDLEGRLVTANPACERVAGYTPEELVGQPLTGLLVDEDITEVVSRFRKVATGTGQSFEAVIRHKTGQRVDLAVTTIPVVVDGRVVGVFAVVKDLTTQRDLEAQLQQAQKMEALGRLAGGIAHDFNNLLTAIHANAELALTQLEGGPARVDVETVCRTAERAAGLTRQLLAFSRKQVMEPRPLDLNALVRESARMLRRTLGETITVTTEISETDATVLADPTRVEQVLLNLAVNAGDAMPNGGRLTIRTVRHLVDEAFARRHRGMVPGDYMTLVVEDTGVGIQPELVERIFEPFFTTKEAGKGTGLGLAMVYAIVKQYGGYTQVESTPGVGTTFTVYLPRTDAGPAATAGPLSERGRNGTERILLVEDEAGVRRSIQRILSIHGYTVLEARNGVEALRVLEEPDSRVDLVMTDLVMPEMGGRELVARLRSAGYTPRVLVMSGYDEQAVLRGEPLPAGVHFLEKPFTLEGILQAVRATIDGG